jgi:tetratricopeptide (TPR) repeat protein
VRHLQLQRGTIDLDARLLRGPDGSTALTELEARLLSHLADRAGRPVPREELLMAVWGLSGGELTRCVDTAVRRLRTKVEVDPGQPRHLLKVHGMGYRLDLQGAPPPEAPVDPASAPFPPAPDRLHGREDELAWLGRALADGPPAVTIVGPPGAGRRRMVREATLRHGGLFGGGVYRATDVPESSVTQAVGAPSARVLIVALDPDELPPTRPGATVLAAADRPRGVAGERVLRLGPLSAAAAVALLADRAGLADRADRAGLADRADRAGLPDRATLPDRDAIPLLADRLDHLPGALLEVAARLSILSVDEARRRVETAPHTVVPHHDAALEARVLSCSAREQEVLRGLAAFVGAFTIEAAEAVTGADALPSLEGLLEAGLVLREPGSGPARLRLVGLVRSRRAPASATADAATRHLAWMLARGEALHARFRGPDQHAARAEVHQELADYVAALATAVVVDPVAAVRLLVVLDAPLATRGLRAQALPLHDAAVTRLADLPPLWRTRLLQMRGEARRMSSRFAEARADVDRALEEATTSGDAFEIGMAVAARALMAHTEGDREAAERGYLDAVRRLEAAGEVHYRAVWLDNLATVRIELGREDEAEPALREVLELRSRAGEPRYAARAREALSWSLLNRGLVGEAESHLRAALSTWQAQGDRLSESTTRKTLGVTLADAGRLAEGAAELESAAALAAEVGEPRGRANALVLLGVVRLLEGEPRQAERRLREAADLCRTSENAGLVALVHAWLAALEASEDRVLEAEESLASARRELPTNSRWDAPALVALNATHLDVALARAEGRPLRARPLVRERLTAAAPDLRRSAELRFAARILEARVR